MLETFSLSNWLVHGLLVRNDGSREATFAVRNECMKKRSSWSLGQMTSSVAESCSSGREKCNFKVAFPSSEEPCNPVSLLQGQGESRYLQLGELVGPLRWHAGETFQAEAALPVWGEHTSYRDLNGLFSYPEWRPRVCFCTRRERFYCPTERWPGRRTCARQTPVSAVPV